MTRISSIFVASALVVLPISAFAQQNAAPAKTAAPNTAVSPMAPSPTAPGSNKAAAEDAAKPASKATHATNSDLQTSGSKTEVHGMNTVKSHAGKTNVPAAMKSTEPSKS